MTTTSTPRAAIPLRVGQPLTRRELQALRGAANGLSNGGIGALLGIAEDTVKTHLARGYRKLGATDRAHAVAIAMKAGILTGWDIESALDQGSFPPTVPVQRALRLVERWVAAGPPSRSPFITGWWEGKVSQLTAILKDAQR